MHIQFPSRNASPSAADAHNVELLINCSNGFHTSRNESGGRPIAAWGRVNSDGLRGAKRPRLRGKLDDVFGAFTVDVVFHTRFWGYCVVQAMRGERDDEIH